MERFLRLEQVPLCSAFIHSFTLWSEQEIKTEVKTFYVLTLRQCDHRNC